MKKSEFIEELKKHIEEANKKQAKAKEPFQDGKQAGIREEAERILKMFM